MDYFTRAASVKPTLLFAYLKCVKELSLEVVTLITKNIFIRMTQYNLQMKTSDVFLSFATTRRRYRYQWIHFELYHLRLILPPFLVGIGP